MTLEEIKTAVRAGRRVCWATQSYEVRRWAREGDREEFFIVCTHNQNTIGLTWRDGTTMNGRPEQFFIDEDHDETGETPGPWEFDPPKNESDPHGYAGVVDIKTANVVCEFEASEFSDKKTLQHGYLIAAAPNLLLRLKAALLELESELDQRKHSGIGEEFKPLEALVQQIRDALAAAEPRD